MHTNRNMRRMDRSHVENDSRTLSDLSEMCLHTSFSSAASLRLSQCCIFLSIVHSVQYLKPCQSVSPSHPSQTGAHLLLSSSSLFGKFSLLPALFLSV